MFISRKKLQSLEKRIADLEGQVQSQQKIVGSSITIDGKQLCASVNKSVLAQDTEEINLRVQ
jgi:uncharacterized coiled-coil protein SlyX